mmetsp:Transcript_15712/g.42546  ORF Transcript_15712/g.42546 Transcript_15712/m.42546 type:complete len:91 (+) Transcript_15712:41-313(+)
MLSWACVRAWATCVSAIPSRMFSSSIYQFLLIHEFAQARELRLLREAATCGMEVMEVRAPEKPLMSGVPLMSGTHPINPHHPPNDIAGPP